MPTFIWIDESSPITKEQYERIVRRVRPKDIRKCISTPRHPGSLLDVLAPKHTEKPGT